MEPITAQEIVDLLEARYAELEDRIDQLPAEAHLQTELKYRRAELALMLLTIDTRGG